MPRLIWTPEALDDIRRLRAFIVRQSPEAAQRAIATIRQSVKMLATYPQMGRPSGVYLADIREWVVDYGAGGYVVLYRVKSDMVAILRVRHGREAG